MPGKPIKISKEKIQRRKLADRLRHVVSRLRVLLRRLFGLTAPTPRTTIRIGRGAHDAGGRLEARSPNGHQLPGGRLTVSTVRKNCPICTMPLTPDDPVAHCQFDPTHVVHQWCPETVNFKCPFDRHPLVGGH